MHFVKQEKSIGIFQASITVSVTNDTNRIRHINWESLVERFETPPQRPKIGFLCTPEHHKRITKKSRQNALLNTFDYCCLIKVKIDRKWPGYVKNSSKNTFETDIYVFHMPGFGRRLPCNVYVVERGWGAVWAKYALKFILVQAKYL